MIRSHTLRKLLLVGLVTFTGLGGLQAPASAQTPAPPPRIGAANLKVNWAIEDGNGRRCSSTASNPYEQIAYANHNTSASRWRRFRCWDGAVEGYMTTHLDYYNGHKTTRWTLTLDVNGRRCSRGEVRSRIDGPATYGNYDSQIVLSGSTNISSGGCGGRLYVNFIEGHRGRV
jgi:hypothetical protein